MIRNSSLQRKKTNRLNCKSQTCLEKNFKQQKLQQNQKATHSKENSGEKIQALKKPIINKNVLQTKFNNQIKALIAQNQQYFQNKIKVCCSTKQNNLKLRIPYRTPQTVYKKQFLLRKPSQNLLNPVFDGAKKQKIPFDGVSTYQNSFICHSLEPKKKAKEIKMQQDDTVPSFMETHYKHEFLNWGGKNYCPSMKPAQVAATIEIPFQGSSVYKVDYNLKPLHPNQKISPQGCFPKVANVQMITSSSYAQDFTKKQASRERSCKPKNQYNNNGLKLSGETEYKGQFDKKQHHNHCNWQKKSVEELQNLMMSL